MAGGKNELRFRGGGAEIAVSSHEGQGSRLNGARIKGQGEGKFQWSNMAIIIVIAMCLAVGFPMMMVSLSPWSSSAT